jgi:hypothetical protein
MRLNLPANIKVKGVTYGTPRVGAPSFADFFDKTVRRHYFLRKVSPSGALKCVASLS